jgi:hypothetical protein
MYADTFRSVFAYPLEARRAFREAVLWSGQQAAISALYRAPDSFGPRVPRRFASAAIDPALIYWTHRDRRPRAVLFRIAGELVAEARSRNHAARTREVRAEAVRLEQEAARVHERRESGRDAVKRLVVQAAQVYARPGAACRVMLRVARRHGVSRARVLLATLPGFYGPPRTVMHSRGGGVLVFESEDEARWSVRPLLETFDAAAAARRDRPKRRVARGAELRAAEARAGWQHLTDAQPQGGSIKEAGRLLAVLFRRRDVDEPPQGKAPPPVTKQLAAMLPAWAAGLIEEAVRQSKKEPGDDPIWNRDRSRAPELTRELDLGRGWKRERDRSRGGGLSR